MIGTAGRGVAPFALSLGDEPMVYALVLWLLFGLFLARVLGQVVAAVAAPLWLPPTRAWYSGLMPYKYLFPAQLLILAVMIALTNAVSTGSGALGAPRPAVGEVLLWASYLYAAAMLIRLVRWLSSPPERRGVFIPIVFHLVLAAFVFVYASWHAGARSRESSSTAAAAPLTPPRRPPPRS
jgi:hypothetical protein